jgi:hypothetical protein
LYDKNKEARDVNDLTIKVGMEGVDDATQQIQGLAVETETLADGLERVDKGLSNLADHISGAGVPKGKADDQEEKGMPIPYGVTSFSELEAAQEASEMIDAIRILTAQFSMLAENVLFNEAITDKPAALQALANEFMNRVGQVNKEVAQSVSDHIANTIADVDKEKTPVKTEDGVAYPASDFAYVPDKDKPSTWQLRIAEGSPGNITVKQVGRAADILLSGGVNGNKVEIPSDKIGVVKKCIRLAYKQLGVKKEDIPDSVKEIPLMIWKESDGTYGFAAVYSNNFRDDDKPSDIISKASHVRYDDLLTKGEIQYPELWLWHRPEWKIGQVTAHAWDDSGFAIAVGKFDKGCEPIAEWISKEVLNFAVSHGMPINTVKRSGDDPSIIVEHITREISPLPAWAAANKLTGFLVLDKEESNTMAILDEKRKALLDMGLGENVLSALEQVNADIAQEATDKGIESKEINAESAENVEEVVSTNEAQEDVVETEPDVIETEGQDTDQEVKEEPITRAEIAETLNAVLLPMAESLTMLTEKLAELDKEIKGISDAKEVTEQAAKEAAPAASLLSMITGIRAIGSAETKVKGTDDLDGGPKEKEAQPDRMRVSPIPFIDALLTANQRELGGR